MTTEIKTAGIEQVVGSINLDLNGKWRVFTTDGIARDAYFDADDDASDDDLHAKAEKAIGMTILRDGLTVHRPPVLTPFDPQMQASINAMMGE